MMGRCFAAPMSRRIGVRAGGEWTIRVALVTALSQDPTEIESRKLFFSCDYSEIAKLAKISRETYACSANSKAGGRLR